VTEQEDEIDDKEVEESDEVGTLDLRRDRWEGWTGRRRSGSGSLEV